MILYMTRVKKMNTQPPMQFFHMYAHSVKITHKLAQNIEFSKNIDTRIKTVFELSSECIIVPKPYRTRQYRISKNTRKCEFTVQYTVQLKYSSHSKIQ